MTGFAPQRPVEDKSLVSEEWSGRYATPRKHTVRAWYGCVDCWARIKPGPPARLTVDEHPTATDTTTTGGV